MRRREAGQEYIIDLEEERGWKRLERRPRRDEKLDKVNLETIRRRRLDKVRLENMRKREAIQGYIRDHEEELGLRRLD